MIKINKNGILKCIFYLIIFTLYLVAVIKDHFFTLNRPNDYFLAFGGRLKFLTFLNLVTLD